MLYFIKSILNECEFIFGRGSLLGAIASFQFWGGWWWGIIRLGLIQLCLNGPDDLNKSE